MTPFRRLATAAMDLSRRGFRCPQAPMLAAEVVDRNRTRWACAVVRRSPTTGACEIAEACRWAADTSPDDVECASQGLSAVHSVPLNATSLDLTMNAIKALDVSRALGLEDVFLDFNQISSLSDVALPPRAALLSIEYNYVSSLTTSPGLTHVPALSASNNPIQRVDLRDSRIHDLELRNVSLNSLSQLQVPPCLVSLDLGSNPTLAFENFTTPPGLVFFKATNSTIKSLRGIDFSSSPSLTSLEFQRNRIHEVAGVQFPPHLELLNFRYSAITCFILRESDVDILRRLVQFEVASISQTSCRRTDVDGSQQQTLTIGGVQFSLSVLSDSVFDARFFPHRQPPASRPPRPPPLGQSALDDPPASMRRSDDHPNLVLLSLLTLIIAAVGALAWILYSRKKRHEFPDNKADRSLSTPSASIIDDIREDEEFATKRIRQSDLEKLAVLGSGGHGIVYLASLKRQREVVVKQLMPKKARQSGAIQQFMDEIRLCASLTHPNIVSFVGISWSMTLADLAVVMEYMANSDLATFLYTQRARPGSRATFTWSSAHYDAGEGRTKLDFALDVANALAYLHSLDPPIIHRDIKASNVLLSSQWTAKLSDFGVSRIVDRTMTADVGTAAWMAPEVFQGAQYDEAADVYSFGVFLSELDTCDKPFARPILLSDRSGSAAVLNDPSNARIALAVVESGVRPEFHEDCPPEVLDLGLRCLALETFERPTVSELVEILRKIKTELRPPKLTTIAV